MLLEVLRELRENTRKAAAFAQAAQPAIQDARAHEAKLVAMVDRLTAHDRVIEDVVRSGRSGAKTFENAARWLERLRPRITRWRVSATLLALLVAFCGGLVSGHWFLHPALWPTGYSTEALCIKADGFWVPLKDGGKGCLFAN